jgi:hypothetical protein
MTDSPSLPAGLIEAVASDRLCNLEMALRLRREDWHTTFVEEDGWVKVVRDGKTIASFARVPAPQHCAAYGGHCEC